MSTAAASSKNPVSPPPPPSPPPEEDGIESPNVNLPENEESEATLLEKTLRGPKTFKNNAYNSLKDAFPPPPPPTNDRIISKGAKITNANWGTFKGRDDESESDPILGSVLEAKNIHTLSEPWIKISKMIATFQTLPSNIEIKEENGTYSISDEKDLDSKDACALKILDRYKLQVESYNKQDFKEDLADFFHQIESNREYHARQLVCLYTVPDVEINKDDLEETTLEGLKQIDLYLHGMNASVKDVYSKIWLVNATMIELGKWEVKQQILKPDYVTKFQSGDVSKLPSHIRMVSRIIKETKGTLANLYPETVLMNYSYFYPLTLYHTGKDPGAPLKHDNERLVRTNGVSESKDDGKKAVPEPKGDGKKVVSEPKGDGKKAKSNTVPEPNNDENNNVMTEEERRAFLKDKWK